MKKFKNSLSKKDLYNDFIDFMLTLGIDLKNNNIYFKMKPLDSDSTKFEFLDINYSLTISQQNALLTRYPELTELI